MKGICHIWSMSSVFPKSLSQLFIPTKPVQFLVVQFFSNVSLLRDILDHIELTRECAILVNLDQEKAFDRVDRSFLLDVLRSYGFGSDFCHWIFTFYHGAFMKILLND